MNHVLANIALGLTTASLLVACGKQEVSTPAPASASASELTDVLKRCRVDRSAVGETACRAAQEEYRRRFLNPSKSSYDPKAASASLDHSASSATASAKETR